MAKTLDVYRDWLGVQETTRPLNFYQLLRLKRFEDNTAKIREHYRKIAAHLRKFDAGETASKSTRASRRVVQGPALPDRRASEAGI
jgi:hypothetical protein